MRLGVVSDTHAVFDPALERAFRGVDLILHAGDVGHYGGHEAIIQHLQSIAPTLAVRGNVDEKASEALLPEVQLVEDRRGMWQINMSLRRSICQARLQQELSCRRESAKNLAHEDLLSQQ
ncbi:hypothetical protein WJX73_005446 [Symbiochloris irregularis]|uniref:Calcineurin-like phosphoesterase domain-containing protein n=1 Tax=Symbiochloris irregularis TaxID=706552 RepID=A0AAW1PRA8_9CHLO